MRPSQVIRYHYGNDTPTVTTWLRTTPPDKREQRRRLWLYGTPNRCKLLIKALRWCYWNRWNLFCLLLVWAAVIGCKWFAWVLLLQIGG